MSDDLVKQLRGEGDAHFHGMGRDRETIGAMLDLAADRIEELEAKLAKYDALMAEARAEGMREAADAMANSPTAEDEDALAAVVAYRTAREKLK